jgi:DNA-binding NtrC family response regulator
VDSRVILLVCASWPQRALVRAQLAADTGLEVIGADSCESAVAWLTTHVFAVVVIDTSGLIPDSRLVGVLRVRGTPVLLLTSAASRAEWTEATAGVNVQQILVRPVFIGEVAGAATRLAKQSA